ncbi:MAG TPA: ATP phosphoribosyltransferase [Gaiellales bacterium]|nr:ATP phosphoribosyltransferase [Gaiellales bacterium]
MTRRGLLRLALPSKGRLAEPATRLLSDAGIQFETTGRTLHAHAHDLDLDLLLARSDDIPVWTAAGDVDLGIAGQNQIVETGADVEPLLELGFGRCRLALAVPDGAAIRSLADLGGGRIATSYPRTVAARLESAGVDASVVTLGGSVELAPRLHAADAIVDLVSSGDTLRQNGLVELETLLESQAVLIARRDLSPQQHALTEELRLLIDSVLAARPKRYVMLNARDESLAEVLALLPGLDAPTVLPLARGDMHAVHAVVDAAEVVRLLGPLRAAGASSILVLPIEHLIA